MYVSSCHPERHTAEHSRCCHPNLVVGIRYCSESAPTPRRRLLHSQFLCPIWAMPSWRSRGVSIEGRKAHNSIELHGSRYQCAARTPEDYIAAGPIDQLFGKSPLGVIELASVSVLICWGKLTDECTLCSDKHDSNGTRLLGLERKADIEFEHGIRSPTAPCRPASLMYRIPPSSSRPLPLELRSPKL